MSTITWIIVLVCLVGFVVITWIGCMKTGKNPIDFLFGGN